MYAIHLMGYATLFVFSWSFTQSIYGQYATLTVFRVIVKLICGLRYCLYFSYRHNQFIGYAYLSIFQVVVHNQFIGYASLSVFQVVVHNKFIGYASLSIFKQLYTINLLYTHLFLFFMQFIKINIWDTHYATFMSERCASN